jgi:hypothetical protein
MERISLVRNRMLESGTSGSVGGERGNRIAYPARDSYFGFTVPVIVLDCDNQRGSGGSIGTYWQYCPPLLRAIIGCTLGKEARPDAAFHFGLAKPQCKWNPNPSE